MSKEGIADLQQLTTRVEAFGFLRKVLNTSLPVAIWRLPNEDKIFAIIDLDDSRAHYENNLEDLEQCFLINAYGSSHPVFPRILKGSVVISIAGAKAELQVAPTTSAQQLDLLEQAVRQATRKQPTNFPEGTPKTNFEAMVAKAIDTIRDGNLEKVVLSRCEDFTHDYEGPIELFERIEELYPRAFCHLTSTEEGTWLGASPEKLLTITDHHFFTTDALAGTQPLDESTSLGEVAWMQKEIEEQAMVSRYIIACFKKIRLREFDEIGPKTVRAGNLAHLKTEFKVDMQTTNSPLLGSTMLDLLHPTSAVCGFPREAADAFIKENEGYDRSLYAGFLGPVGFEGATRLFVNLRCLQLIGNKARLYAGAGITEDSQPHKEMAETAHKMQTLLKALHS